MLLGGVGAGVAEMQAAIRLNPNLFLPMQTWPTFTAAGARCRGRSDFAGWNQDCAEERHCPSRAWSQSSADEAARRGACRVRADDDSRSSRMRAFPMLRNGVIVDGQIRCGARQP